VIHELHLGTWFVLQWLYETLLGRTRITHGSWWEEMATGKYITLKMKQSVKGWGNAAAARKMLQDHSLDTLLVIGIMLSNFCACKLQKLTGNVLKYVVIFVESVPTELWCAVMSSGVACFSEEQDWISPATDGSDSGNCSHVESQTWIPATVGR